MQEDILAKISFFLYVFENAWCVWFKIGVPANYVQATLEKVDFSSQVLPGLAITI